MVVEYLANVSPELEFANGSLHVQSMLYRTQKGCDLPCYGQEHNKWAAREVCHRDPVCHRFVNPISWSIAYVTPIITYIRVLQSDELSFRGSPFRILSRSKIGGRAWDDFAVAPSSQPYLANASLLSAWERGSSSSAWQYIQFKTPWSYWCW